jgi:hypothetical protein
VQLSWLALFRAMKKKHLRVRDLFEKLDADGIMGTKDWD